jgi:hypothetical protein
VPNCEFNDVALAGSNQHSLHSLLIGTRWDPNGVSGFYLEDFETRGTGQTQTSVNGQSYSTWVLDQTKNGVVDIDKVSIKVGADSTNWAVTKCDIYDDTNTNVSRRVIVGYVPTGQDQRVGVIWLKNRSTGKVFVFPVSITCNRDDGEISTSGELTGVEFLPGGTMMQVVGLNWFPTTVRSQTVYRGCSWHTTIDIAKVESDIVANHMIMSPFPIVTTSSDTPALSTEHAACRGDAIAGRVAINGTFGGYVGASDVFKIHWDDIHDWYFSGVDSLPELPGSSGRRIVVGQEQLSLVSDGTQTGYIELDGKGSFHDMPSQTSGQANLKPAFYGVRLYDRNTATIVGTCVSPDSPQTMAQPVIWFNNQLPLRSAKAKPR